MPDRLQQEIRELVAEILEMEPDEVTPEANFAKDLGADSMTALEVMATLEKRYSIVIPPAELPKMATLGGITGLVRCLKDGDP